MTPWAEYHTVIKKKYRLSPAGIIGWFEVTML